MVLRSATSLTLSISAIKSTGTLVVLCIRVLLCTVVVCYCLLLCFVVCCCVFLCVRGVGRSPCSCVVWAGIQGVGAGWQGPPSPSHYSVGIHGCLLVGGGCYTVGAQSIAQLAQNYANSLNSISGHRCPRELCFFLFERSSIGEEFRVLKKNNI
jgi:hypothetical protein